MNKRQLKKQYTRYWNQEAKAAQQLSSLFVTPQTVKWNHILTPHPRRHWMSPGEYQQRKDAVLAEIEAERIALRELMKTHDCTVGGWIPKIEVQVVNGQIAHQKWSWRDSDGQDIEMDGPLAFVMQLSCGHRVNKRIDGKSEEDLRQEYVGKNMYCEYCR